MDLGNKISIISVTVTLVIGIPTIIGFYPPLVGDLFNSIPQYVLSWSFDISLILAGFSAGWILRGKVNSANAEQRIEGCLRKDNVDWKGEAIFSDGNIKKINVSEYPYCPDCGAELSKVLGFTRDSALKGDIWKCPSDKDCGFRTPMDREGRNEVRKLFKKCFEEIVETRNKKYSLSKITSNLEDPTAREIWESYSQKTDKSYVSTSCFNE